jgi:hypothetical protein
MPREPQAAAACHHTVDSWRTPIYFGTLERTHTQYSACGVTPDEVPTKADRPGGQTGGTPLSCGFNCHSQWKTYPCKEGLGVKASQRKMSFQPDKTGRTPAFVAGEAGMHYDIRSNGRRHILHEGSRSRLAPPRSRHGGWARRRCGGVLPVLPVLQRGATRRTGATNVIPGLHA